MNRPAKENGRFSRMVALPTRGLIPALYHRRFMEEPDLHIRSDPTIVCLLMACLCLPSVGCTRSFPTRWFGNAKRPVAEGVSDSDESSATETKVAEAESRYRLASHRTAGVVDDHTGLSSETSVALKSVPSE